jgi:hypothetical protein
MTKHITATAKSREEADDAEVRAQSVEPTPVRQDVAVHGKWGSGKRHSILVVDARDGALPQCRSCSYFLSSC